MARVASGHDVLNASLKLCCVSSSDVMHLTASSSLFVTSSGGSPPVSFSQARRHACKASFFSLLPSVYQLIEG